VAFTEALRLVVDADTRGAVTGIEHLGRTADRELSRSEQSIQRWGNRLTAVGAGMVGLGAVALVGLGAAAMASEEANLATVKLENTLKNMPKLAGESSGQFIELAESIQSVTAADADAIVGAEAVLGTFQLTADEIKRITPLVVDYSRKFGVDLPTAAVQVGKALDGNIGALRRVGISIDETAFAADRFGAVHQALSDQVGGFAEAEGATFAGSLQRLKNELGDVAEGVGVGAVDAFSSMFGVVEGLTSRLNDLSPAAQQTIGTVATFGSVGLIAAGGLSIVVGQTLKSIETFKAAGEAAQALAARIGGLAGAARGLAILGPLAIGAGIALQAYSETKAEATRITDKFAAALREEADGVEGATSAALGAELTAGRLGSKLREAGADLDIFTAGIRSSGDALEKLDDEARLIGSIGLAESLERAGIAGTELGDELLRVTENMSAGEIIDLVDRLDGLSDRYDDASESARNTAFAESEVAGAHGESAAAIGGVTEGYEEATSAAQEYQDTIRAMLDPLFGAVNASQQLADANTKVIEAEFAVAAAIRDHGAGSLEAMAAQDQLTRAEVDAASAALGQEAAMITLAEAVGNGTVSLQGAKDKLAQWVAQGLITQASADATAAEFDRVTGAAQAVPESVSTSVSAPGAFGARIEIEGVGRALNDVDGDSATVTIHANYVYSGYSNLPGAAEALRGVPRQHGGPVYAGQAYVVGEHRPELFIPDTNGTIMSSVPPAASMSAWGGGGGGYSPTYVINVNGGLDSAAAIGQRVVESIQGYERSNGPGWRN